MNDQLSAGQIEQYQRDGFTIIRGFLDAAELEVWRRAVCEAVEKRGNLRLAGRQGEQQWTADDGYYGKVFTQRVNLWMDNPAMKEIMIDERLGRLAAELEGVDGMRIWHDQALIKEPWGNPTAWHLDNPIWSYHCRHATSIWVALDDVDEQNGCLYFIPGSHLEARFENSGINQDLGGLFDVYPEWKGREPVAARMKAGDCSFHNGLTAHGAGANMTPRRRRAMTCGYMPDGSTFNGQSNVLPPDYLATLKVGDVLNNDAQNPLLWKRS